MQHAKSPSQRAQEALPWVTTGVCVAAIVLYLTRLFNPSDAMPLPPSAPKEPAHAHTTTAQAHLFGTLEPSAPPAQPLALTLEGVAMAISPEGHSRAIIRADGQSRVYGVGQSLADGTTLRAISRNHVTLEHNGRLITLALPRARSLER